MHTSWIRALVATILVLGLASVAHAARTFPENSHQVRISGVADDSIVADGAALHLSPAVLIYTPTNSTIVKGELQPGVIARIQLDMNGDVRKIWILTPGEIIPRPWWQLWGRQPDGNPSPMPDATGLQPNPNR